LSTAVRPKKREKGPLDKYLINGPPTNVDDVAINDRVPCGIGVSRARKEAEGEGIKTVAGIPVSGHPLAIHIAIFCPCRTLVLREPLEHVNENNVWFAEAPLLEGGTHPNQNSVKEDISEGSIHGDDVSPYFLVEGMFRTSYNAVIFVRTIGIVRYFVHSRWDWCEGVRVCIRHEETIYKAWTRTEKKIHSIRRWGAMCLGTSTHME
jgi:hypothetical protein